MAKSLRIYTDAQIPKAVADKLREQEIFVIRCQEVGLADANDEQHFEYALREGCAILTADQDFLRLGAARQKQGNSHTGIIYILPYRQGDIGTVVKRIATLQQEILSGVKTPEDLYNQVIYIS